jgi:hypothetical protein
MAHSNVGNTGESFAKEAFDGSAFSHSAAGTALTAQSCEFDGINLDAVLVKN